MGKTRAKVHSRIQGPCHSAKKDFSLVNVNKRNGETLKGYHGRINDMAVEVKGSNKSLILMTIVAKVDKGMDLGRGSKVD